MIFNLLHFTHLVTSLRGIELKKPEYTLKQSKSQGLIKLSVKLHLSKSYKILPYLLKSVIVHRSWQFKQFKQFTHDKADINFTPTKKKKRQIAFPWPKSCSNLENHMRLWKLSKRSSKWDKPRFCLGAVLHWNCMVKASNIQGKYSIIRF